MADLRTGPVPLLFFLLALAATAAFVFELRSLEVPETRPGQGPGERGSGNGTGKAGPLVETGGGGGGAGPAGTGASPGAAAGGGGGAGRNDTQDEKDQNLSQSLVPVDSGQGGAGRAESAAPDLGRAPAAGGQGGAGRKEPEAGGGGPGGEDGGLKIEVPEWAAWAMTVLVVVLVAAGVGRMLLAHLRSARRARLKAADKALGKRPGATEEEILEEMEAILDEGVLSIEGASDVRAAIVQSYSRMVGALASRGIVRERSATPGEFRLLWSWLLGAPSPPMEGLTSLFEEAVYSVHPMGEPHRLRAREQLRAGLEEVRSWKGAAA